MNLHDCFERIVVINLPFKTARRERLERHLRETGLADPAKVTWERGICGDWTWAPAWWGGGNGAWGCLRSHVRIAEDAIHDGIDSYLVLEDDVVFHERAPEMLAKFWGQVPADWDQLYLGGQYLHKEPEPVEGAPWVLRPFNVNRTHAFALRKKVLPRFLAHVQHAPDFFKLTTDADGWPKLTTNHYHIDHQLGVAHERRDWNTYTPLWWFAGQEAGDSNVSGRVNPRMWWHWRGRGRELPVVLVPPAALKAPPDGLAERLHFGYTLKPGTFEDFAIGGLVDTRTMVEWLNQLSGEAIERWLLPALPLSQGCFAKLARSAWPKVIVFNNLSDLPSYPDPFHGI